MLTIRKIFGGWGIWDYLCTILKARPACQGEIWFTMLKQILKKETESLKTAFIEKRQNWAIGFYATCEKRSKWNEVQWCEYLGVVPEVCNKGTKCEFLGFPTNFHNKKSGREYHIARAEVRRTLSSGLEKFVAKEVKMAEIHYEASINKLAVRIEKKDLNVAELKVVTSHMGANIETTLTDGIRTVRAFTIIAEGEIQRPHYRYLIK